MGTTPVRLSPPVRTSRASLPGSRAAVGLGGTLRSELRDRVASSVARYIRDPAVQARPLIRILVEGDVGKPGFYAVPPELPLADVIGAAGGLTQRARATGMRVQRGR